MTDRLTEEELAKMETARFLLEPPAPEVVGQLLAEVRRLREECHDRNHIGFGKLMGPFPVQYPDPTLGQDVAFIAMMIVDLRARLSLYELPEGERDETLVCCDDGTVLRDTRTGEKNFLVCDHCREWYSRDESYIVPRWRYELGEKIKHGEVPK
jgi:hypothetical protein